MGNSLLAALKGLLQRGRERESIYMNYFGCKYPSLGLPRWFRGKKSTYQCRRHGFDPWVRKVP